MVRKVLQRGLDTYFALQRPAYKIILSVVQRSVWTRCIAFTQFASSRIIDALCVSSMKSETKCVSENGKTALEYVPSKQVKCSLLCWNKMLLQQTAILVRHCNRHPPHVVSVD